MQRLGGAFANRLTVLSGLRNVGRFAFARPDWSLGRRVFHSLPAPSENLSFNTSHHLPRKAPPLAFPSFKSVDQWLDEQPVQKWQKIWQEKGVVVIEDLLEPALVLAYRNLYQKMLLGEVDCGTHRWDLGSNEAPKQPSMENVCQIMWPSVFVERLEEGPLHQRTLAASKAILGDDSAFDFDMLIYKAPYTDTSVPWHQDEEYWPDMPDKRAASCWVALDDTCVDNGCMWFVPGSHLQPLRQHRLVGEGSHVLACEASECEADPVPLRAGSCTIHSGGTLHYSRGNSTDSHRRAYIANFRPAAMIEWERNHGCDHAKAGLDCINYSNNSQELFTVSNETEKPTIQMHA